MMLNPRATSAEIGTGDLLIQRVIRNGVESQFPATLQYVFATVPALVSYDDGHGHAIDVGYPVKGPDPGPGGLGTRGNPFPVSAPAGQDVVVTLTIWRPQRRSVPGETGEWVDMGGLNYSLGGEDGSTCPQAAFDESDDSLRPIVPADVFPADYAGVKDVASDGTPSAGNKLTFEVDLSRCLSDEWPLGETRHFSLNASNPGGTDSASQWLSFGRQ